VTSLLKSPQSHLTEISRAAVFMQAADVPTTISVFLSLLLLKLDAHMSVMWAMLSMQIQKQLLLKLDAHMSVMWAMLSMQIQKQQTLCSGKQPI